MKVGDYAEISRTFSALDLRDYVKLSGHIVNTDRIPEPLIGALFSFLLGVKLPGKGTMYLKQETSFLENAVIGESLVAEVKVTRLRPEKHLADLSTTCRRADGKLIASGRALVYIRDVVKQTGQHD
jgi:3-hydroxybutyryl-CoA dehydratase